MERHFDPDSGARCPPVEWQAQACDRRQEGVTQLRMGRVGPQGTRQVRVAVEGPAHAATREHWPDPAFPGEATSPDCMGPLLLFLSI